MEEEESMQVITESQGCADHYVNIRQYIASINKIAHVCYVTKILQSPLPVSDSPDK